MYQFLESTVFHFFKTHLDPAKPLLLGISGGADSVCLLHLLLKWKKKHPLAFHLVHVDHGWREESAKEALELECIAKNYGLAFHTKRLDPSKYRGNVENESRRERFAFFIEVNNEVNAQAIVLGHHADDQAETVLKRILEGAPLTKLHGILPKTTYDTLTIFRPLCKVTKKEIQGLLESKEIPFFTDKTNSDSQYLRARMRQSIFPVLQTTFGKNCASTLVEISEEALELKQHMDALIQPFLKKIVASDLGFLLKLDFSGMDPFILRCLVKEFCSQVGFEIRRSEVTRLQEALIQNEANVRIKRKTGALVADRRALLYLTKEAQKRTGDVKILLVGEHLYDGWKITVTEGKAQKILLQNSWKDVWGGEVSTLLPKAEYKVAPMNVDGRRKVRASSKVLKKLLHDKKVPHVLWDYAPLLLREDLIVEDFLTGSAPEHNEGETLHIVMQRISQKC